MSLGWNVRNRWGNWTRPSAAARPASDAIRTALVRLRWAARVHLVIRSLARAVTAMGLVFGGLLVADYVPTRVGLAEPSVATRGVLLALASIGLAWFLARRVIAPLRMPLDDHSLALVLERRFPQLADALTTAVRPERRDGGQDYRTMLRLTEQTAAARLANLPTKRTINARPTKIWLTAAAATLSLAGLVAGCAPEFARLAWARIGLLSSEPWPRRTQFSDVHLRVVGQATMGDLPELVLAPRPGETIVVALGTSVALAVEAHDATPDQPQLRIPARCTLHYATADGQVGRAELKRVGRSQQGRQVFQLDGPPLERLTLDTQIEIRGGDARWPIDVRVVTEPFVDRWQVICQLPDYLVNPDELRFESETFAWHEGAKVADGSHVRLRAQASRPLRQVYYRCSADESWRELWPDSDAPEIPPAEFDIDLGKLTRDVTVEYVLEDIDRVRSSHIGHLPLLAVVDEAPAIDVRLDGVGPAITPQAQIPLVGTVDDDYGVARTWAEITWPDGQQEEWELALPPNGQLDSIVDMPSIQPAADWDNDADNELGRLTLVVKARDACDGQPPHVGSSPSFELDIVSPEQFLRLMEGAEIAQRRRLEQIERELVELRDLISHSRTSGFSLPGTAVAGSQASGPPELGANEGALKLGEVPLLYARRAQQQARKSAQEIDGVAAAFDNIRRQLINNRLATDDRQSRLADQIIAPLDRLASDRFGVLDRQLAQYETALASGPLAAGGDVDGTNSVSPDPLAIASLQTIDGIVIEVQAVLAVLVKYETHSQLLEIVRRMLDEQRAITERTHQQRYQADLEGLLTPTR